MTVENIKFYWGKIEIEINSVRNVGKYENIDDLFWDCPECVNIINTEFYEDRVMSCQYVDITEHIKYPGFYVCECKTKED